MTIARGLGSHSRNTPVAAIGLTPSLPLRVFSTVLCFHHKIPSPRWRCLYPDAQSRGRITTLKFLQRELENWLPIPHTGGLSPNARGDGKVGSQKGKQHPVQGQTGRGKGQKSAMINFRQIILGATWDLV